MPEATIERDKHGRQVITCDWVKLVDNELYWYETWEPTYGGANNLDRLYAVLHTWHMAQAYDKTYLAKVEQAAQSLKDDDLYKSDGAY